MTSLSVAEKAEMLGSIRDHVGSIEGRVEAIINYLDWQDDDEDEDDEGHPFTADFLAKLRTDTKAIRRHAQDLAYDLGVPEGTVKPVLETRRGDEEEP
jgi:hypothetical protein